MKKIVLVACIALLHNLTYSQGTNYRAQGKYYSAKERYENKEYESALDYIYESKELLKGTNYVLQYLHIVSAYYGGFYEEAQKEMETFFHLEERQIESVRFSRGVDELTSDETKELTKLIDKIDEAVEYEKVESVRRKLQANAEQSRQEKINEVESLLTIIDNYALNGSIHTYLQTNPYKTTDRMYSQDYYRYEYEITIKCQCFRQYKDAGNFNEEQRTFNIKEVRINGVTDTNRWTDTYTYNNARDCYPQVSFLMNKNYEKSYYEGISLYSDDVGSFVLWVRSGYGDKIVNNLKKIQNLPDVYD